MISILYIGNLLSKFGHTPGVVETLGKQLEAEGIRVYYGGYKLNKIKRFLEMMGTTIKYRKKVDFVLIDTYSTSAFWFAFSVGMLCRLFSIKYIPILHGGNLPERLKRSNFFCDQIFKKSYQNVAVSGYLHHYFNEAGYSSIIIPNNIDIDDYKFTERSKISPNILWVRSFHRDYNPNMAIDTLMRLMSNYKEASLCMVGPEKDSSLFEFKKYAEEKGIVKRIKITGRLSKTRWHDLSRDFDVFINTTNYDNTPVSVLEAMALGLPVVSTNVGGIPFLLKDGEDALLVNKNDADAMAQKIELLLDNPEIVSRITLKARYKVSSFDWSKIKTDWLKLLSNGTIQ